MGRKFHLLIAAAFIPAFLLSGTVMAAVPNFVKGTTWNDVSWPKSNCIAPQRYLNNNAVIGVNGGLDFHHNPCLKTEALRYTSYSLYANTGYPGGSYAFKYVTFPDDCSRSNPYCLAYNYGYNAGKYTVEYAASQGVHSLIWWLDVESDNSWTNNPHVNREEILGEAAAIKDYTGFAEVGIYSYPGQWDQITGKWKNGLSNWVATGSLDRNVAVKWCKGYEFTGGETILSQYTTHLDENYVCVNK